MGHSDFRWKSDAIATRLRDHGIRNRSQLAHALMSHGIGRTTVYRVFTEAWEGEAPQCVIKAMARLLDCSAFLLVHDHYKGTS